MSGLPLELQILSINVLGLADSTLNWSWLKWDRQLEKISNFSVSQSDELNVKDIDWLKTILSWIVVIRFVINRVSLLAYVANIYTIVTRSRQNLLVLWMVLSFFKDIVLEVVVIVTTFLLWHKGSFSTSLLVEFIAEKTICLVMSTCKWCATLKWYMQLRRVAKFRRFSIIARRSIMSVATVPGRVGRSLDDECLGVAIIRRGKYASLLNLNRHSEELVSRANAKSLTTLITDDTNGANDYNSDVHDLSVAEKSMRMLNVTAEDVMDARARIQERSYWDEQDSIAKTPEVIEDVIRFPLVKDGEEIIDTSRNKQSTRDALERTVDHTSMRKEEEKDYKKIDLFDKKELIPSGNQEDVSLIKSEDIVDRARSMEPRDISVIPKKKRKEVKKGVAKILQCPSFQDNARDMAAKPCASLVRKLEAKLCTVSANQWEKWIDRVERKRYSYRVDAQLTSTGSSASKKERCEDPKVPCACRRTLRNSSKNEKHAQSIDIDDKNAEYDINGKEFRPSVVNVQRSKADKSAFRYSEAYRLKKQTQKWEESREKQSWGIKSVAQTARSSGYAKNVIDSFDKLSIANCRKSVQIETCDESIMTNDDSLNERHNLAPSGRSVDLCSFYDAALLGEKNYAEVRKTKTKVSETSNNFTLENKREMKARKRYDLLSANHKLSIERREAIELKALKVYNELTLLEDKKELEVRKERDSLLNCERSTREFEVAQIKVSKTYNDPTLPKDKKKSASTRGHNLSPSSSRSADLRSISRVRNEFARSGNGRELQIGRKRDSSRDEASPECVEDVEPPANVSNRLSMSSCDMIPVRRNAISNLGRNDRFARQAHMSLNLMEITRNIEWTVHPRGIVLTNKSLHGRFLESGGRSRESQQRDIVDDNTASMLHNAFFFKPEIITRIFQPAYSQRLDEFFLSFPTFRQVGFNMEFACRVNNETIVYDRDSLLDRNLERTMWNDRNNLGDSMSSNLNDNRGTGSERGNELCVIFIDQQEMPSESQSATEASTTVGSREDARSSIESIRMTNILVFDEDHNRVSNTADYNLPVRLITGVLRNFDTELSEGNVREHINNVNVQDDPLPRVLNADDINLDEENTNERDRISSRNNADDDIIDKIEQILNSTDNCLDNVNVTSCVNSLEQSDSLRDKNYLSRSNIYPASEIHENNLFLKSTDERDNITLQLSDNNNNKRFDTLDNKTEKSMFNSKLSFPGPSSFIKSDNCHAPRSCDEELQILTEISNSAATLNDQRKESLRNLKVNCGTVSQFRSVETSKLETAIQDGARSRNEHRDKEANEFSVEKIFKMHSDDKLQQDDSFYFTYERNDDPGTPVSLESSLMEEFLNDPLPPLNSSYS